MNVWKYKRISPKVIAAKLSLIKPEDMANLAGRNLTYIQSMLTKTQYRPEIIAMPTEKLSSLSLETAFLKNFIRTCEKIMEWSPKDIRFLLHVVLKKLEVGNIKAMLRAKVANIRVDEALEYITPVGRLNEARCRRILESSNNVNDVVELLLDLEYGLVLMDVLREYEKTGVLLLLEIALDKYVYGELWRAAEKLNGLDKKIAETVLGIEIASVNIKVILRCRAMGSSEDKIRRNLIPISGVFEGKELEETIEVADIEAFVKRLSTIPKLSLTRDYQYMLTDIQREYSASRSLPRLETALDKSLLKTNRRMLKRYTPFFNIGLILAFLNLKWFEVRNLRAIVNGIEDGVSPSKIRKLLILPI
ncbi:MAG: V-type ATPase subunit [Candidatus Bathyarchaeota archaeon]|nr:MAG: V-type ATPase subunit [Candidatus Bathyarchaeota archaeon]